MTPAPGPRCTRCRSAWRTRFSHPLGTKQKALSFPAPTQLLLKPPSPFPAHGAEGIRWLLIPVHPTCSSCSQAREETSPSCAFAQLLRPSSSPEGLRPAQGGTCPIAPAPGQNKLHFTAWRCKGQQALGSRSRSMGIAVPFPVTRSHQSGAGFAHGVCLCVPVSAHICVYVRVSVRVRVAPCVWWRFGCVWVSLRIGLSANLLEHENKAGSLAAVPRAPLQHRFQTAGNRRADDRAHTLPFGPSPRRHTLGDKGN